MFFCHKYFTSVPLHCLHPRDVILKWNEFSFFQLNSVIGCNNQSGEMVHDSNIKGGSQTDTDFFWICNTLYEKWIIPEYKSDYTKTREPNCLSLSLFLKCHHEVVTESHTFTSAETGFFLKEAFLKVSRQYRMFQVQGQTRKSLILLSIFQAPFLYICDIINI